MTARVEVLTFCSRIQPTLALQEVQVTVDAAAALELRAMVDISKVHGRAVRRTLSAPGRQEDVRNDGSLAWESLAPSHGAGSRW